MAERTPWDIDPAHSSVEFAVKHMMFTTVRGRFKDVSGTLEVDEARPDDSVVEVELATASIDTGVDKRDDHLRSGDFLNVENHPKITFRSTRIEGASTEPGSEFKVVGDLTIRGTTREVVLDATFGGRGTDPWGKERFGVAASAKIDRRKWGIEWNQALEAGGILVGNEVKIELEVQAVQAVPATV